MESMDVLFLNANKGFQISLLNFYFLSLVAMAGVAGVFKGLEKKAKSSLNQNTLPVKDSPKHPLKAKDCPTTSEGASLPKTPSKRHRGKCSSSPVKKVGVDLMRCYQHRRKESLRLLLRDSSLGS